jgi:fumarate hydratase class II
MPIRSAWGSNGQAGPAEIYELAQGGTAVGTGLNTKKGWDKEIAAEIAQDHQAALRHRAEQVRGAGGA